MAELGTTLIFRQDYRINKIRINELQHVNLVSISEFFSYTVYEGVANLLAAESTDELACA
jgi:hypothetical protein